MREWLSRAAHRREIRIGAVLGTAMIALASCGGLALSRYTVAGMNSAYYTSGHAPALADSRPKREERWFADLPAPGYADAGLEAAQTASR